MFKTDKKYLEELSFGLDERDIANFKAILERLKSEDLLTISREEVDRAIAGLETIGQLKLDGKIYAFHVEDSYAARQSGGTGEGVDLFLRQGDKLEYYHVLGSRDEVYCTEEVIEFLKKEKKSKIYTGPIPVKSGFLGLLYNSDTEDPLIRDILKDYEIEDFESEGITVVKLESLI